MHSAPDRTERLDTQSQMSLVANLSDDELMAVYNAGREVLHWQEILAKTTDTPITDLLRGVESLDISEVYPESTVEDHETGCQYYFHAHEDRTEEYGHYHTYVMNDGIPHDIRAARPAVAGEHQDPHRTHCHLVAIGLDDHGTPQSMFTTNHWSTQDAEYDPEDLAKLLDCFDIGHAVPSYPVNRWVSEMLRLFRPQIRELFVLRSAFFDSIRSEEGAADPAGNEDIEVPSIMPISVPQHIANVQAECLRRGLT